MSSSFQQSALANIFLRPDYDQTRYPSNNADEFEFNESDLYFDSSKARKSNKVGQRKMKTGSAKVAAAEASRSVPVSIPAWSARRAQTESDVEEEEERVPPHEYLARKRGASLSVHEGAGRTLKGRDMTRVRNAIWKKIGFAD